MNRLGALAAIMIVSAFAASVRAAEPAPPTVAKKPFQVTSPNGAREDDYYWLRDDTRKNPEMLAYLKAENAYADAELAPTKPLQDKLYGEIVGRIKQDDASVPYKQRGYWYYTRFETGKDYPILARRKGGMTAPEEVMLNEAAMGAGKGYFQVGDWTVSPDNRLLAYAEDDVGRRQYVLHVKDLVTGKTLTDVVDNVEPNLVWADDDKTVFYIAKDPVTLLSKRVKAHGLGTPASADRLVYEEADDSFYMGLQRTRSDKFICIVLESTVSNEQRCASAADPTAFAVVAPREREFRYEADHLDGRWVIRTNWNAKNYKLMSLPGDTPLGDRTLWRDLVPENPNVFIENFTLFHGAIAIEERSEGLKRLAIRSDAGPVRFVDAEEPAYAMALADGGDADTLGALHLQFAHHAHHHLRNRPEDRRAQAFEAATGDRLRSKNYVTERVWITARDGVKVPVSLVYRKGFKRDGAAAMLQYAYGSYGISTDPSFSVTNVSLLDRGMVYAIAHIRGGQEMGRGWYDDGHLLNKKNTFTDFIDVTRGLVAHEATPKRIGWRRCGGSAGGLLDGRDRQYGAGRIIA